MKILITESQLKYITENQSDAGIQSGAGVDAVLVGGLDYRSSDYPISQQVEILKKGFGTNKNVKGFRYNAPTSEILNFLSKNPKVPVFLFSAGCTKAKELSNSSNVDKKNLFIVEPFASSQKTTNIVQSAVSNGVPASNVFVGGSSGRGAGVVSGASSSNSSSHWGALTKVGSMKSGVVKSNDVSTPDINDTPEEDGPKDVKKFQTWLDKNHPGWHRKYGTLDDNEDRGWGIYGPNTKRSWGNTEWREKFLSEK